MYLSITNRTIKANENIEQQSETKTHPKVRSFGRPPQAPTHVKLDYQKDPAILLSSLAEYIYKNGR